MTRDPAGRAGSYSKSIPYNAGNRPDPLCETPFSSISLRTVPLTATNRIWLPNGTTAEAIAESMRPFGRPARMLPVLVKAMYSPAT